MRGPGVPCFRLLQGGCPFVAQGHRAIAQAIRESPPAPLRDDVPREAARIVARCLSKAPELRYANGGAVASALAQALGSMSRLPAVVLTSRALASAKLGEALPPPAGIQLEPARERRRHPLVVKSLQRLAVVFGLIVVGGATVELWVREHDDETDAAYPPQAWSRLPSPIGREPASRRGEPVGRGLGGRRAC